MKKLRIQSNFQPINVENSITQLQNSDGNILLHLAKDRLYLDAELFWWGGLWASIIVSIGGMLVYFTFIPSSPAEQILGVIGGLAGLFLAGQFEKWAEKRRRWAARVQEQSDLALYDDLSWNYTLEPEGPLNPDIITGAVQRSKADKKRFLNWYTISISEMSDKNQQALLCQRESLSFDYLLRIRFAQTCFWVLLVIVSSGILLSWWTNPTFQVFLLQIALPLSGLIKFLWDNYESNIQTARELEQMEIEVRKKLNRLEDNPQALTTNDLRDIQDFIFRNRSTGLPVPDRFYKKLQPKIETTIQSGTKSITKKV